MRIFLVVTFQLVLCFSPSVAASESGKLIIGVNLPLSGDVAEYGIAVKNGIEMARQQDPKLFEGIVFIYDDNKYDGRTAVTVFHKHHDVDGVAMSFVWGDTPSLAVAPVAEKSQRPIIAVLTDPKEVRRYNYVIRFISSRYECTDVLVRYLRNRGISKLGLLYAQSPYNENYMLSLKESIDSSMSLTLLGDFLPEALDFRTSIVKAKAGEFDAVGLYLLPSQVRAFLKQAKTLALDVPLFGMDVFQSKQTIEESEGLLEGAVFPSNRVDDEFEQQYASIFRDSTHLIYAANGFEFAKTVAAIKDVRSNGSSAPAILDALRNLPDRDGALGKYGFLNTEREGQHFAFPVVLKRIEGTEIKIVPLP